MAETSARPEVVAQLDANVHLLMDA